MSVLALGNGESRLRIDINKIESFTLIGCNAIVRDHRVNHLICVDRRMVREAISHPNCPDHVYTRQDWINEFKKDTRVQIVPDLPYTGNQRADEPFHWGSGPYAVLLSAIKDDDIHLLGFDLWSKNKHINNVYKGTENYNCVDYRAVDPKYWIHQISMVFQSFSDKYFTVYVDNEWKRPDSWNLVNVKFKSIDFLKESL